MLLNTKKTAFAALAACTVLTSTAAFAGGSMEADTAVNDGSLESAITNGTAYVDARYRYEYVDQNGFADSANASTLRTNLGYKTGTWNDLSAVIEVQNITAIGEDDYNDTINTSTRPVIADPESTEVNEAKLIFTGIEDTTVVVGRQRVDLDNQRHIGTVGFRQNDQTYDAIAVVNNSIQDVTATYGYVDNVNRINGDDHANGNLDTHTHLFNVGYTGLDLGKITAYGYLIDLNDAALSGLSSETYGLRFAGKTAAQEGLDVTYAAEYAIQSDYADNTSNYDANYYLAELGLDGGNWNFGLGYEVLGADGAAGSFQTVLGTNHAFNGWADVFSGGTPANGLEDMYVKAHYTIQAGNELADGIRLCAAYHQFDAEQGGADYGDEVNLGISKDFGKNYSASIQYANYSADTFSVDTEKYWLTFGAKF